MSGVFVLGVAATPCRREPDVPLRALVAAAVAGALADSGIDAGEIEAVVCGNALGGLIQGQECIRGEVLLQGTRLMGLAVINVENACASGSTALHTAYLAVASGVYETVLVLGAEKMSHEDRTVPLRALEGALDVDLLPPADASRSVFMDIYATKARRHAERHGSTPADLAAVVVKSRGNASLNPIAQFRQRLTVDEVLAARPVVEPFTLPMCSPIGDAAATAVVSAKWRPGAVRVLASALRSAGAGSTVRRAAEHAYEQAGFGPDDIDVAEVHDAAASAEIEESENLGFAPEGEGHLLAASGATAIGGRIPLNPSGGLISRGHPIGATGVLQIVELVDQLRDRAADRQVRGARHALAQNAGGILNGEPAVGVVTILASERGAA